MKKIFFIIALMIAFIKVDAFSKPNQGMNITFDFFYSSLSPHGEWLEFSSGVYGWRPYRISYGWRPYTVGRWAWTSYGWYWDSYENFGWATYHYGRWHYDNYYGWVWIPDYEWAPAWVEWRYDDDYIGWAPLPPYASFRISFGIYFSMNWVSPYHHWNFVRYNYFNHHHMNNYLVNDRYRYRIYNNSKYRTNYGYESGRIMNNGVEKDFIERKSGSYIEENRVLTSTRLKDANSSRDRNTVEIYRPDREDVNRARQDNFNIKQTDRRTNLDVSKLEIARDRTEIQSRIKNRENIDTRENTIRNESSRINRDGESMRTRETETRNQNNDFRIVPKRNNDNTQNERTNRDYTPRYDNNRTNETPRIERNNDSRYENNRNTNPPRYERDNSSRFESNRNTDPPRYERINSRSNETYTPRIERRNDSYTPPRENRSSGTERGNNSGNNERNRTR